METQEYAGAAKGRGLFGRDAPGAESSFPWSHRRSGWGLYCTATATLSCELWTFAPGSTYTIDISLNTTGTGTFTSNVTVQSGNDSTAGNNSGPVQLSVTGPQAGGGGGRLEWLALVILGLMAANRARRSRPMTRVVSRY
jgi:hypothetical protein